MNRTPPRIRRSAIAALAATAVLATSAPALADPPATTVLEVQDAFVDTDRCEFPIDVAVDGTVTIREFFDKQGQLTRAIAQVRLGFTASTESAIVHQRARAVERFTFDGDGPPQLINSGVFAQIRDEDGRLIAVESGRRIESPPGNPLTFVGNPRTDADIEAQCAALSD